MTRSIRNVALPFIVLGALVAMLSVLEFGLFYGWRQKRMVKRVLAADPAELLVAGRTLIASRPGFVGDISPSSSEVPRAIRTLKPTHIFISTNSLSVEFSDPSNPFGIIVYAVGVGPPEKPEYGRGPLCWIDGLWVYDDGQLEEYDHNSKMIRLQTR